MGGHVFKSFRKGILYECSNIWGNFGTLFYYSLSLDGCVRYCMLILVILL